MFYIRLKGYIKGWVGLGFKSKTMISINPGAYVDMIVVRESPALSGKMIVENYHSFSNSVPVLAIN